MTDAPIRLRGHHLLCMLTYGGHGYTPAFVACFNEIVRTIRQRATVIEIARGVDDICRSLHADADKPVHQHAIHECPSDGVGQRDEAALEAIGRVLGMRLGSGMLLELSPSVLDKLHRAFKKGTIREVTCDGCKWDALCTETAQNNFRGTLLTCG